ncbi:MAG: isoprenyl transferase [Bacteroidia bacterium]|nr:isoprenyl transferase [Bacteroidia bacterium]
MSFKEKIDKNKLPEHIAIIMDGNGRWAKSRNKNRMLGHQEGVRRVREITETCAELGIKYLTVYAFSTENWDRPKFEVNALMQLLVVTIGKEIKTLMNNNIRLETIGDTNALPRNCVKELQKAADRTKDNDRMTLILALSYSSRWEIVDAAKRIAEKVRNSESDINEINEEFFSYNMCTAKYPDPELLIRTSGEYRISNFLLWQIAYAELYFTDKYWPDFKSEDLYEAIVDYQSRERRFGKTGEQIKETAG